MPYSHLGAAELAIEIERLGEKAKFETEIFGLKKIQSLKMGGILAVNKGSTSEPRFCILKYMNGGNAKPWVLVGKGVVYDTGGLSLKPTAGSMDKMKSDMGGAAVVAATIYSIAKNKLPVNVIGLIPATDNMPGPDAIAPGDVITMYDKSTVEVLNTDAEGRLILADALSYSSKFNPALVIDLATLTGSAYRAFGTNAMAMMGTAREYQGTFETIGNELFERVISLPLWNDYGDQLKSDIADLKNIGGPTAGMITAGKFLEHFVKHPWLHFDIAGVTFLDKASSYRGKNASGKGVRLMYHFIKNQMEEWKNQ